MQRDIRPSIRMDLVLCLGTSVQKQSDMCGSAHYDKPTNGSLLAVANWFSIYLSFNLSIYLSIILSITLSLYLSIYRDFFVIASSTDYDNMASIDQCLYWSIYQSIYIYIYIWRERGREKRHRPYVTRLVSSRAFHSLSKALDSFAQAALSLAERPA
jgi:hypothetical protein